jgi:transcriptional regulator with XRE-family HTH domain
MILAERLKELREGRKLSQGDVEKRTGLLRCYISRVENGHTVPSVETLEKLARALEMPMYQLFYDGEESVQPLPVRPNHKPNGEWGTVGREARYVAKLTKLLARMEAEDRSLLLFLAQKVTNRRS